MTNNEQIYGIFGVIDLWASNAVRKRHDASVYNHYNAKELAKELYNACYLKIDENCAVITKDELKQYKVQVVKEFAEELKECAKSCKEGGYDGIDEEDIDLILKEYEK